MMPLPNIDLAAILSGALPGGQPDPNALAAALRQQAPQPQQPQMMQPGQMPQRAPSGFSTPVSQPELSTQIQRRELASSALGSGVESLQERGGALLRDVNHDIDTDVEKETRAQARQVTLAQMIAAQKEKATDNDREERSLSQRIAHETYQEQHPAPIFQFGTLPGAAPDAQPELAKIDPRTGKVTGTGLGKPPAGGAANNPNSEKEFKELTAAVSTGARGTLSKDLQKSLNSAENLKALILGEDKRLVDLTPQQKREAYTALNNLIAKGGSSAVSQIEHLAPDTLADQFANAKQYLLNEPAGTNSQAMMQNVLDTALREEKVGRAQLRRAQIQSIPNYAHLRKADSTRFESILRGAGIDPASIDEKGLEVSQSSHPALKQGEVLMLDAKGKPHAVPEAAVAEAEKHNWKRQ